MFDHVTFRVSDFRATGHAYRQLLAVLGAQVTCTEDRLLEWGDFGLSPAGKDHPPTTGVHVGLVAADRATVDAFWRTGLEAGFGDDGAPGPRARYGGDYYGAFLRDPDGNSVEACLHDRAGPPGVVDHLWLRVADLDAARHFYAAVAPHTGFALAVDEPGLARFRGSSGSFTVLAGDPPSSGLHLAFPASGDGVVRAFHAAALAAGAPDNGAPGERPEYHPGYYGAFALDPDGNNIEVVSHNRP